MLALKVSSPRILMFDCLKFGARFFKLGIAMVAMVCVGFGLSYGWQKLFVENDEFLIQDVKLKTMEGEDTRFLNHERLVAQTGLDPMATIFSVDTDALKESLLRLPEITEAKVSRRLPGILKVEVTERRPVAWVACRSLGIKERDRTLGLLVDEDGIVFPCASEALWIYADKLPVVMVRTAKKSEIVVGEKISHNGLGFALDLVNLAAEKLEGLDRPAWVVVKDEILLEMKTLGGVVATLSYYEQERQLDNLSRLTSYAREQGESFTETNLIPRRFVPVQYR
ncbi:MAG: hypothetical protein ACJAQT_002828 [Akkermansiaceae bacterium]|jgi:hypothetical protein